MCPAACCIEEYDPVRICMDVPIPIVFVVPNVQPSPMHVEATAVFRREHRGAVAAVIREEQIAIVRTQRSAPRAAIAAERRVTGHRPGATQCALVLRRHWSVSQCAGT